MILMTRAAALAALLTAGAASAQTPAAPAAAPAEAASPAAAAMDKAYRLMAAKKPAEAAAAFRSALKLDPANRTAMMELGYLHAGMKQWKQAEEMFGRAMNAADDQQVRVDRGHALAMMGEKSAAAEHFKAAAAMEGELKAQALDALAAMGASMDEPASAMQERLLDEAYEALSKRQRAAARRKLEAALAMGEHGAVLKQLGYLDLQERRTASAVERFEAALRMKPDDHPTRLDLGYAYQALKREEQAKAAFAAAAESADPRVRAAAQAALAPAGAETDAPLSPAR